MKGLILSFALITTLLGPIPLAVGQGQPLVKQGERLFTFQAGNETYATFRYAVEARFWIEATGSASQFIETFTLLVRPDETGLRSKVLRLELVDYEFGLPRASSLSKPAGVFLSVTFRGSTALDTQKSEIIGWGERATHNFTDPVISYGSRVKGFRLWLADGQMWMVNASTYFALYLGGPIRFNATGPLSMEPNLAFTDLPRVTAPPLAELTNLRSQLNALREEASVTARQNRELTNQLSTVQKELQTIRTSLWWYQLGLASLLIVTSISILLAARGGITRKKASKEPSGGG